MKHPLTLSTAALTWAACILFTSRAEAALIDGASEPAPVMMTRSADHSLAPLDGFQLEGGQLYRTVDGKRTRAESLTKISSTLSVGADGSLYQNDQFLYRLENGAHLCHDGALIHSDGRVTYAQDHLVRRAGRLYLVEGEAETQVTSEQILKDGTCVNAAGRLLQPNGHLSYMSDGQILKLGGAELPAWDSVSVRDGKVILFKDGEVLELKKGRRMGMSDGSIITGEGEIIQRSAASGWSPVTMTLAEGTVLRIEGAINEHRLFGAPRRRS